MASTTITLRPEHGHVLIAAGALSFEALLLGGAVGFARGKLFGAEFKKRPGVVALFEEHKKARGSEPFCVQGYPDMGNGRFSQHLTYAEWLSFNNAQRGHHNALESLPGVLACLFAAGSLFPTTATALAATYGVGRIVYAWCACGGARCTRCPASEKARRPGAIASGAAAAALWACSSPTSACWASPAPPFARGSKWRASRERGALPR